VGSRLALVAALSVAVAASTGRATAAPRLTGAHPCPGAAGFTCSTLAVPLDHTGHVGGILRLAVAAADNAHAPKGPLLLISGGPGESGVPFASEPGRLFGSLSKEYRLVFYDQRGTGSGALACPALQAAMGFSDLYPAPAAAVRACAAAIGARRSLFGTDDVVADMEDLRTALGAAKWTLDGISYGTFVGERYAIAHPARVKKLVLDSVVPHSGRFDLGRVELPATARVLRLACRERRCAGDPAADLAAVVRTRGLGPQLLDALTFLSIVDPAYRQTFDVPKLLHSARGGDASGLLQMLATVHHFESAPARLLSQGLHASALCSDWRFPWGSSAAAPAGRAAALRRAAARLPTRDLWPFDRATVLGNGFVDECLPWPPTAPTPAVPERLPNVPTLLLAGDRDLSTPLEWAREEAAVAPDGRLVVVHGAGHSVQSRAGNNAGRRAVLDFLIR